MNFSEIVNRIKLQINSLIESKGTQGSPKLSLDGLLGKVDRKLVGIIFFSIFMVIVGFGNLLNQWSLSNQYEELSEKSTSTEQEVNLTLEKLTNLYKQHSITLEQAKLSPKSSAELLRLISESIQRSGMVVTKVTSSGNQSPDVFVIEAEGGYGGIRMLLTELRYYSASMDIKAVGISAEPTRRTLVLSTTFKYIPPPKFDNLIKNAPDKVSLSTPTDYLYDDGESLFNFASRKELVNVQFVPQSNNGSQQSTPKAQSSQQRLNNESMAPETNPFFVPSGSSGATTGSFSVGSSPPSFSGSTRNLPVRSNDGMYVIGCMSSARKSACIFQLSDGTTSIINLGGQISKNLILSKVSTDSVVVRNDGKELKVKIGDQIR